MEPPPGAVWGTLIAVGAAYEVRALRRGRNTHTLSHLTRRTVRIHTPVGRRAFICGWTAFALWYLRHILEEDE